MQTVKQTRDEAIASEYTTDGFATLESIGQKYNLTRERVRQIIGKSVDLTPEELAEKRRQYVLTRHREAAVKLIESDSSIVSIGALCEATGMSTSFVSENAGDLSDIVNEIARRRRQNRLDTSRTAVRKFNDDDIIATLRRMSAARDGLPITVTSYQKDRLEDEPSLSLVHLRMKSLIEACEKAGVAAGAARRRRAVYDKDDLIASIKKCSSALGMESVKELSYLDYSTWAKRSGEPSGSLVRLNFGSWKNAKDFALKSLV